MKTTRLAAVVLAAGKGTRMRSELPKVLHPLLGLPLLAHPLESLRELEISPIVAVVGYGRPQVMAVFSYMAGAITFVEQAQQLGTGHAANQAREALEDFQGHVLIVPGDVPLIRSETLRSFIAEHRTSGATLTVMTTRLQNPSHYGRIVREKEDIIARIVEAKDADEATLAIKEINSGIYLVDAGFLFSALARVDRNNAQAEYYLTDIVEIASRDGKKPRAWCYPDSEELNGVNDRAELASAERALRSRLNHDWMRRGVTMQDPATTYIECAVQIEPDVFLEAGVQLKGATFVSRGCRIGAGAVLRDVRLEADVEVGHYAVLEGIAVPEGAYLAPFMCRTLPGRDG